MCGDLNKTMLWPVPKDPLDCARLYESIKHSEKCGHEVSLDQMVHRLVQERHYACPICDAPITGLVQADAKIYFKYGKVLYRLAMPHKPWWNILDNTSHLAQCRIQDVLGISSGIKILHKGKVLFPSSSLREDEVSRRILELSDLPAKTAPVLLVMGTPSDKREQWMESERQLLAKQSPIWQILPAILNLCMTVVSETVKIGIGAAQHGFGVLKNVLFPNNDRERHQG